MWRPDPPLFPLAARALPTLACCLLASCGGGEEQLTPQQRNPSAGIYSGSDNFGNPASVVITPAGEVSSVTVSTESSSKVLSASTAAGELTPLVFSSSRLYTVDLPTAQSLVGSLTVNYTQSVRVIADFVYPFFRRTVSAGFLTDSFPPASPPGLPAVSTASLYTPTATSPYSQQSATWSLSSDLAFTISAGACVLSGKLSADPSVNVYVAAASLAPGCAAGDAQLTGHLWRDVPRGYAYLVLKSAPQPAALPVVVAMKL